MEKSFTQDPKERLRQMLPNVREIQMIYVRLSLTLPIC